MNYKNSVTNQSIKHAVCTIRDFIETYVSAHIHQRCVHAFITGLSRTCHGECFLSPVANVSQINLPIL